MTPEKLLRWHFLAAPFGGTATTYGLAYWFLCKLPTLQNLADFASFGVLLYGMTAVSVELLIVYGGKLVFYGIASIIKQVDKLKSEQDARAVERVARNPELLQQANDTAKAKEREKETAGSK